MNRKRLFVLVLFCMATGVPAQSEARFKELAGQRRWRTLHPEAAAAIARNDKDAVAYFARGLALLERHAFEEALADLERAESLGLKPRSARLYNFRLDRVLETARDAVKHLPLRARYPASGPYQIGVRYRTAGRWSALVEKQAPALVALAQKVFGQAPDRLTVIILDDPEHGSLVTRETGFRLTPDVFRDTSMAFGFGMSVKIFAALGSPARDSFPSESRAMQIVAHEFTHAMEAYMLDTNRTRDLQWWTEGLAMYGQEEFMRESRSEVVAAWRKAYANKKIPDRDILLSEADNSPTTLDIVYRSGGLMVRTLVEEKGIQAIRRIIALRRERPSELGDILKGETGYTGEGLLERVIQANRGG